VIQTFDIADYRILSREYVTAAKALERMQKKGIIKKRQRAFFITPNITVFVRTKAKGRGKYSDHNLYRRSVSEVAFNGKPLLYNS